MKLTSFNILSNMDLLKVLLLCFIFDVSCLHGMQIKNLELTKCDDKTDPISLSNVFINFDANHRFVFSGTMKTDVDLEAPIRVDVVLERHIGWWIKLPCEHNKGSCSYSDVCKFAPSPSKSCPDIFVKNKVPCRCPIPKGEYTIPKLALDTYTDLLDFAPIDGKYKATINASLNGKRLACYNAQFSIVEDAKHPNSV